MNTHLLVAPFDHALRTKRERLREAASRGKKVLGYFCTYTPVEILHAGGFLPVRIWGGRGPVEKAYSLVPNFICPYMKRSLENALNNEYDFLSGLVQGYTCDVACGLVNIWKGNIPMIISHSVPLPYNDTLQSREFLRSVLGELMERLSKIGGSFPDGALGASWDLYTQIRRALSDLSRRRSQGRLDLDAADFVTVVQAGFVTEPEAYLTMLKELVSSPDPGCGVSPREGIPVLVSGSVVEDANVLALIGKHGLLVVADDLCTGLRSFTPASGMGESPLERLVDRTMKRFPCPSRSHPRERIPLVKGLVADSGARGVIFLFQKFCTPHLADHPMVSQALRDDGIPSISIEMDEDGLLDAQVATRLETFSGMLEAADGS
ncbi:MAG: 2-hydroxyacyl-CoA dehydratase family protein [Syntrophaceae bacterium]|nr:2-hydroxyacyl-CoA dehydratase family protein [Deltaproteobacteria bacterium]